MWQQISSNKAKSFWLIAVLAILFVLLGFISAEAYERGAGIIGIAIAVVIWFGMFLTAYFAGDKIALQSAGAVQIKKEQNPMLYNVVEEITIAAGLPKIPDIYVIDDASPNAFACGRNPQVASVAVTTGLLSKLNREELQGVIAHELSHIKNYDILFMLYAGVFLGAIVMISEGFIRSTMYSSRRSSRSSSDSGGQAIIMLIALVFMILAPIMAQLLYFAVSRKREYLADACSAQFTRNPVGLANALYKISTSSSPMANVTKASAPMYIVNPLNFDKVTRKLNDLSSTHPSTKERIAILTKMAGADLTKYDLAFKEVKHSSSSIFNKNTMLGVAPLSIVEPSDYEENVEEKVQRKRQTEDMMWKLENYIFIECDCGTKLKLPQEFKGQAVKCPHCKKIHKVM